MIASTSFALNAATKRSSSAFMSPRASARAGVPNAIADIAIRIAQAIAPDFSCSTVSPQICAIGSSDISSRSDDTVNRPAPGCRAVPSWTVSEPGIATGHPRHLFASPETEHNLLGARLGATGIADCWVRVERRGGGGIGENGCNDGNYVD